MIIECVPNFSEGRDARVIDAIVEAAGDCLLDRTSDIDHNRTVLTLAGAPDAVAEAAFSAIAAASKLIDISKHQGVHPRIGAADVIPFVPLKDATPDDCAAIATAVAERVWRELRIPSFLYEAAARRDECRRLEAVRKLAPQGHPPDIGEGRHQTAGACVIGARRILVAWNINLRTTDLAAARAIAGELREANGGFPAVKTLGLPLASREQVQVSINLIDYNRTAMHEVFEACSRLCEQRGIEIAGSELIGMIPQAALDRSNGHDLRWLNLRPDLILDNRLGFRVTR